MGFKIDLPICGELVECDVLIIKDEHGYKGFHVEEITIDLDSIVDLTQLDHVNKYIIDGYLESVGE